MSVGGVWSHFSLTHICDELKAPSLTTIEVGLVFQVEDQEILSSPETAALSSG